MFDLFDNQTHKEFRVRFYLIADEVNKNSIKQLSSIELNGNFVQFCSIGYIR